MPRGLRTIFERSERSLTQSLPIRPTSVGVWVPTPIQIIEEACTLLVRIGSLGAEAPQGHILDAGTGDGRVPAVVSQCDPTRQIYGVEKDPTLYAMAVENIEALHAKNLVDRALVRIVEGNYCDIGTYASAECDLGSIALIFNYPDGNQSRLARFVRGRTGPRTRLCLLTHDATLALDDLVLESRHEVDAGADRAWHLSIYGVG